jgi:hypothetical protein
MVNYQFSRYPETRNEHALNSFCDVHMDCWPLAVAEGDISSELLGQAIVQLGFEAGDITTMIESGFLVMFTV